jgi:hypothetical protein
MVLASKAPKSRATEWWRRATRHSPHETGGWLEKVDSLADESQEIRDGAIRLRDELLALALRGR